MEAETLTSQCLYYGEGGFPRAPCSYITAINVFIAATPASELFEMIVVKRCWSREVEEVEEGVPLDTVQWLRYLCFPPASVIWPWAKCEAVMFTFHPAAIMGELKRMNMKNSSLINTSRLSCDYTAGLYVWSTSYKYNMIITSHDHGQGWVIVLSHYSIIIPYLLYFVLMGCKEKTDKSWDFIFAWCHSGQSQLRLKSIS